MPVKGKVKDYLRVLNRDIVQLVNLLRALYLSINTCVYVQTHPINLSQLSFLPILWVTEAEDICILLCYTNKERERKPKKKKKKKRETKMEVVENELRQSKFKRICVFCGSSPGKKASYKEAAIALAKELVMPPLFYHSKTNHSVFLLLYIFSSSGFPLYSFPCESFKTFTIK